MISKKIFTAFFSTMINQDDVQNRFIDADDTLSSMAATGALWVSVSFGEQQSMSRSALIAISM